MAELQPERKKRIFSAIQPSGTITLGNYLGTLKNWVNLQDDYDCVFALADLHTITARQVPADFRKNTLEAYALLLACGIDTTKSTFFIQSQVHTHAELAWILNCYTQFGELSRMIQFKEKSAKSPDNVNVGLFAYPTLQAADILLYQADFVPIGADQKQHLELSRDIADRFNGIYSPTFTPPEPLIQKTGARIMSLQDPTKKMSKSDENANACVRLLDSPAEIMKKFKRAVTDSDGIVAYGDGKEGINNLMGIYSCVTGQTNAEIESAFKDQGYGVFKEAVANAVINHLTPIQERYNALINEKTNYLEECYTEGAKKALWASNRTLSKVMKKVGFIPKTFE